MVGLDVAALQVIQVQQQPVACEQTRIPRVPVVEDIRLYSK
jgi:hypothetical protein